MDMDSAAFNLQADLSEGEALSVLDWSGLVARLGAERDLRRELGLRIGAAASFSAAAATVFPAPQFDPDRGEPGINPADLGNGKAAGGITPAGGEMPPAAGNDARGQE